MNDSQVGLSHHWLQKLGDGFKYVLFSPLLGEMIHFDEHIFQRGWFNHQPENHMVKGMWTSVLAGPNFFSDIQNL